MSQQFRNICFTSFNLDERLFKDNLKTEEVKSKLQYCIYQWEICPDTGREHAQGYAEFKDKVTLKFIKTKVFGDNSIHIETRKGTQEQAIYYCEKEATRKPNTKPFIYGEIQKFQGKRSDLDQVSSLLKQGKTVKEVAEELPNQYIKYNNGIEKLHKLLSKPNKIESKICIALIGSSRVRKTSVAYNLYPLDKIFKLTSNWWDGYNGEEVIIIDEITTGDFKLRKFLDWTDPYPTQVNIKGKMDWLKGKVFFFTSNVEMENWCEETKNNPKSLQALKNRFDKIYNIENDSNADEILEDIKDIIASKITKDHPLEKKNEELRESFVDKKSLLDMELKRVEDDLEFELLDLLGEIEIGYFEAKDKLEEYEKENSDVGGYKIIDENDANCKWEMNNGCVNNDPNCKGRICIWCKWKDETKKDYDVQKV